MGSNGMGSRPSPEGTSRVESRVWGASEDEGSLGGLRAGHELGLPGPPLGTLRHDVLCLTTAFGRPLTGGS